MSAGGIHLSEAAQKGKFPEGQPTASLRIGFGPTRKCSQPGEGHGSWGESGGERGGVLVGSPASPLANHAERSNTTIPTARPTQSLCKHDCFHKQLQITWERRSLVPAPCTLFSTGRIASKSRAIGHVLLATTLMMLWVSSCNAHG